MRRPRSPWPLASSTMSATAPDAMSAISACLRRLGSGPPTSQTPTDASTPRQRERQVDASTLVAPRVEGSAGSLRSWCAYVVRRVSASKLYAGRVQRGLTVRNV